MTVTRRLALLVNMVPPYRVPICESLADRFDLLVICSKSESNRSWTIGQQRFRMTQSKGWTFRLDPKENGTVMDRRYVHLPLAVIRDLLRFRPDFIISSELGARTLFAVIAGWLLGVRVCVWWGGTPHTERHIGSLRKLLRRALVPRIGHWLTYGSLASDYIAGLGVHRDKITQLQNAVDERPYLAVRQRRAPRSEGTRFICVSQLIGRKGIDRLLHACSRLAEARRFSLLIAGSGPESEHLQALAHTLRIADLVQFAGSVAYEEMPGLYSASDCLVLPTLEDAWGLVVNEALWSGTSVLASNHAGAARDLLPTINTFDPTDERDILAGLRRACDGEIFDAEACLPRLRSIQSVAQQIAAVVENDLARTRGAVDSIA